MREPASWIEGVTSASCEQRVALFAEAVATLALRPLTARELEVAYLVVVEQLTLREVAERLVISVKTAESHLQHLNGKLNPADWEPSREERLHGPRRGMHLQRLSASFWMRLGAYEERAAARDAWYEIAYVPGIPVHASGPS